MKKLEVEKMIDLELWLSANKPDSVDNVGALDYFALYYQGEDLKYLSDAFTMPFQEINLALTRYDSSHPKMDELAFVGSLQTRYCMSTSDVLRRIRQVRRINRFLSQHPNVKFFDTDNSLVNDTDEWDSLINKDKDVTDMVKSAITYEERKDALVSKYEVLRQMIEFNGLSLDDIKEEADRRRDNKDVQLLEKKNN